MLTLESHRWSVERGESQMWHIEYVVLIRRSVYMSVLLYVHLKNDVFPISLFSPLYQVNTPSLTNVITYPHCFQTACKRLWCLYIVGGASDSKNPELYCLRSISDLECSYPATNLIPSGVVMVCPWTNFGPWVVVTTWPGTKCMTSLGSVMNCPIKNRPRSKATPGSIWKVSAPTFLRTFV